MQPLHSRDAQIAPPPLNKDASLKTEWGAVLQYKVNSDWNETGPNSSDSSAFVQYGSEDGFLWIDITNTKGSLYKYNSESTYSDWIDYQEEYHTQAPKDQDDPTYTDYSLEEIGTKQIGELEFRIYKMTYTVSFPDSFYEKVKAEKSDFKQNDSATYYYALIKDGPHDLEITANSEPLLNEFLGTLSIKW